MRFISRIFSLIFLAIAIIAAVVDTLESVGSGALRLTPLGQTWEGFNAASLAAAEVMIVENAGAFLWDPIIAWILIQPTVAVFLALSFVFYILSYKRKRREDRFLAR
ncbi:MAG: hypothetical protein JJ858_01295 [Rhizobiaceae bacterium]|nr:hypothetical protein [Rhizobiaceae bacterium]